MTQQHETDIHPDDRSYIWTPDELDDNTTEHANDQQQ